MIQESKEITPPEGNAIIKKRNNRTNQRKRDSSDEEEGSEIDREKLKDLKLLHQLKQRQSGVAVQELVVGDKKSEKSQTTSDDLKTKLGNQFNSHMDYGLQQSVPHQNIMESFVNEKLGLNNKSEL